MDTQLAFAAADHPQSRVVVTDNDPDPPASGNVDGELLTCSWHFCELGAVIPVEVCVDVHAAKPAASANVMARAGGRFRRRMALTCVEDARGLPVEHAIAE